MLENRNLGLEFDSPRLHHFLFGNREILILYVENGEVCLSLFQQIPGFLELVESASAAVVDFSPTNSPSLLLARRFFSCHYSCTTINETDNTNTHNYLATGHNRLR